MQAFTWKHGQLTEGIEVVKDHKFGLVVLLGGEDKRIGERYEKIQLGHRDPAIVESGCYVREAHPRSVTTHAGEPTEKSFWVLERLPRRNVMKDFRDHVLVKVCTSGEYKAFSRGHWKPLCGNPFELAKGHGARGATGMASIWDDGLLVMRGDDAIKVVPEGDGKVESQVIFVDHGIAVAVRWSEWCKLVAEVGPSTLRVQAAADDEDWAPAEPVIAAPAPVQTEEAQTPSLEEAVKAVEPEVVEVAPTEEEQLAALYAAEEAAKVAKKKRSHKKKPVSEAVIEA